MKSIKETRCIKILLTRLLNLFSDGRKKPDVGHLSYQLPFLKVGVFLFLSFFREHNTESQKNRKQSLHLLTWLERQKKAKKPLLSPSSSHKGELPPLALIGHRRKKSPRGEELEPSGSLAFC